MATLREYYEKDFAHQFRLAITTTINGDFIDGAILCDLEGLYTFVAFYVADTRQPLDYFMRLLSHLKHGRLTLNGNLTFSAAKQLQKVYIENNLPDELKLGASYFGDTDVMWISTKNMPSSRRVFIYSETNLQQKDITILKEKASAMGYDLLFRAQSFRVEKMKYDKPLAFISYDSRDREIARKIADKLELMLCPVWYDEFSLTIGDNLRESIEKGLKECRKCILILRRYFLSNSGWTKVEFESIFTRQLLEEQRLVLPIWCNVSKRDIYEYCPSLANVCALDWQHHGIEEIAPKIYNKIMV